MSTEAGLPEGGVRGAVPPVLLGREALWPQGHGGHFQVTFLFNLEVALASLELFEKCFQTQSSVVCAVKTLF